MTKKTLSELTVEKLNKKEHTMNILLIATTFIVLILLGLNIYFLLSNGEMTTSFIIPIALVPILILNVNNIKKIKKELILRNN